MMSSNDDESLDVVTPPARKKRRRRSSPFAVLEDEDEDEQAMAIPVKPSTKIKLKKRIGAEESTRARKSARLERKRQEQKVFDKSVKDILQKRTLENCLEDLKTSSEYEESESKEYESSASNETPSDKSFDAEDCQNLSEKVYADGDGDLDDFICDDNQVEYMNGEKGDPAETHVFVESEDLQEDTARTLEFHKSRTKKEWFHLYVQYLEHCIVDPKFDKLMRQEPSKYSLFQQSLEHIERELHFRYQTLLNANGIWPADLTRCIQSAARISSARIEAQMRCDACKHRGHAQAYRITFSGYAFDATRLYRGRWMKKLLKGIGQHVSISATFQVGNICRARIISSWELLHSKRLWCALIDHRRKCCSSDEFLPEEEFSSLVKKEFGRYKKLISAPERFMGSSKSMKEVCKAWSDIYKSAAESKFLMTGKNEKEAVESDLCSESDIESVNHPLIIPLPEDETGEESVENESLCPLKRENEVVASISEVNSEKYGLVAQNRELIQVDVVRQMKCLVCEKNPRDGAILHDRFIHLYCCYACGLREKKKGTCAICNRVISKVYRVSALDDAAPAHI